MNDMAVWCGEGELYEVEGAVDDWREGRDAVAGRRARAGAAGENKRRASCWAGLSVDVEQLTPVDDPPLIRSSSALRVSVEAGILRRLTCADARLGRFTRSLTGCPPARPPPLAATRMLAFFRGRLRALGRQPWVGPASWVVLGCAVWMVIEAGLWATAPGSGGDLAGRATLVGKGGAW